MFFLYQILITILLIFSPLIIFFRILKKKEDKKRYKEKFCFPSKRIWIQEDWLVKKPLQVISNSLEKLECV